MSVPVAYNPVVIIFKYFLFEPRSFEFYTHLFKNIVCTYGYSNNNTFLHDKNYLDYKRHILSWLQQ
jgi:hypothetical protein